MVFCGLVMNDQEFFNVEYLLLDILLRGIVNFFGGLLNCHAEQYCGH